MKKNFVLFALVSLSLACSRDPRTEYLDNLDSQVKIFCGTYIAYVDDSTKKYIDIHERMFKRCIDSVSRMPLPPSGSYGSLKQSVLVMFDSSLSIRNGRYPDYLRKESLRLIEVIGLEKNRIKN